MCVHAQVKRLLNDRLQPSWSFATFYLVKDSLALMLECGGLTEDAYQEVVELEACYLETLERGAVGGGTEFGGCGGVKVFLCAVDTKANVL